MAYVELGRDASRRFALAKTEKSTLARTLRESFHDGAEYRHTAKSKRVAAAQIRSKIRFFRFLSEMNVKIWVVFDHP